MLTAAIHFGFQKFLPKYASEFLIRLAHQNAQAFRTVVLGQNRRCALLLTRLTQLHLGLTSESVTHIKRLTNPLHSSNSPLKGVTGRVSLLFLWRQFLLPTASAWMAPLQRIWESTIGHRTTRSHRRCAMVLNNNIGHVAANMGVTVLIQVIARSSYECPQSG